MEQVRAGMVLAEALAAGLAAFQAGDDDGAIRHYGEALMLLPDHPVALMGLGLLREKRGEIREARALFARIVELYREGEFGQAAQGRLDQLR